MEYRYIERFLFNIIIYININYLKIFILDCCLVEYRYIERFLLKNWPGTLGYLDIWKVA